VYGLDLRQHLRQYLWQHLRQHLWQHLRQHLWQHLRQHLWQHLRQRLRRRDLLRNVWHRVRLQLLHPTLLVTPPYA